MNAPRVIDGRPSLSAYPPEQRPLVARGRLLRFLLEPAPLGDALVRWLYVRAAGREWLRTPLTTVEKVILPEGACRQS